MSIVSALAHDLVMVRRHKQPDRSRKRAKATLSEGRVKVSIATAPSTGPTGGLDGALAGDVELAKAAVLYADTVELIGLGVSMLGPFATLVDAPPFQILLELDDDALAEIGARSGNNRVFPDDWRDLMRQFNAIDEQTLQLLPAEERQRFVDFRTEMMQTSAEIMAELDAVLAPTGFSELRPAIDANIITVADLGLTASTLYRSAEVSEVQRNVQLLRWLEVLLERLDDKSVRLLFDEASGSLIQKMIDEGEIEPSENNLRLAAQAALGAGFAARLPALVAAPMDELLDLRRGLDIPLTAYRGAIVQFSKSIPQAVDANLNFEVQQLWEQQVMPSVLRLEEELARHSLVREMARSLNVSNVIDFAGWTATTSFAVGSASSLGLVVSALVGTGAGAMKSGLQLRLDAGREADAARRDAAKSEFYFLYEANRRAEQF